MMPTLTTQRGREPIISFDRLSSSQGNRRALWEDFKRACINTGIWGNGDPSVYPNSNFVRFVGGPAGPAIDVQARTVGGVPEWFLEGRENPWTLLLAARAGARSEFPCALRGDLQQMAAQKNLLVSKGVEVQQNDVTPCVRREDWRRALLHIWADHCPGWWHYERELVDEGICSAMQFDYRRTSYYEQEMRAGAEAQFRTERIVLHGIVIEAPRLPSPMNYV